MKYYFFLPLFLFACGSDQTETIAEENPVSADTTDLIEEVNDDDFYLPEDPVERDFDITEMPDKWWLLSSDEDGMLTLWNYWDAQDEYIEFYKGEEGAWMMDILYAQDTDQGKVTDFQATILEGDGISKVEGSFTFGGYFQDEPRTITFNWDQLRYHAEFINLMEEPVDYVPDESKDFFPYEETFREDD